MRHQLWIGENAPVKKLPRMNKTHTQVFQSQRLLRQLPAINHDRLAVDKGSIVGGQKRKDGATSSAAPAAQGNFSRA